MRTLSEARRGNVVVYKLLEQYSRTELSYNGCYLRDVAVGCSYVQGRLVKRLDIISENVSMTAATTTEATTTKQTIQDDSDSYDYYG